MFCIEIWDGKEWQPLKLKYAERCLAEKSIKFLRQLQFRITQESEVSTDRRLIPSKSTCSKTSEVLRNL